MRVLPASICVLFPCGCALAQPSAAVEPPGQRLEAAAPATPGPGWSFERTSAVGRFGTCFLRFQADARFAVSLSDIFPSPATMSLMVSAPPGGKPFPETGGYLGTWTSRPGAITLEMRSLGGAALHGLLGVASDPRGIAMSALSGPSRLEVIDTSGRTVGAWDLPPVAAYDQGRFVQCYRDEVLRQGEAPRNP